MIPAWRPVVCLLLLLLAAGPAEADDLARWRRQAAAVSIDRDQWGIAHVSGRSDADAVFGMIYAQAEDDFARIEHNYLVSLGWLAQAEGETALYQDLRQRLFIDSDDLKRQYHASPPWLRRLMTAWADGLNYYLATHTAVQPTVIRRFEPWMALSFTEGSIGGDIESIDLAQLEQFYGHHPVPPAAPAEPHPGGSNGFAIAPGRSASGHALLWINPHTSFYFRSELQMTSKQGLNAYGAVTWGQFFIYQGFNPDNGWMHTSNGGDAIDEFRETIAIGPHGPASRFGHSWRPLMVRQITIPYRQDDGRLAYRDFSVYRSLHGPIVRAEGDRWIAVSLLQSPVRALEQSYLRTKTHDYEGFKKTQAMLTDSSNNTVYADRYGTIAYFHGNFIPKRDPRFDYTHPVDGSDPATAWQGPHPLADTIMLKNPASGWIQNTNNWPFAAAGADSPKREDYPVYMWSKGENARGLHAVEVLQNIEGATLDSLIAAGYDPHLTAFDALLPPLLQAYQRLAADDPRHNSLASPIAALAAWDHRTGAVSVPTTLAIFWAQTLAERLAPLARQLERPVYDVMLERLDDAARLDGLATAIARLEADFGRWQTPWGEVNRFQRLSDDIKPRFDDDQPSLPIGLAPAQWGALASFDSIKPRPTRKIYGSVGNSFVAAVEFGPRLSAKAIMTGGASGDPASPHFADQMTLYAEGRFRDVLFYPDEVAAHRERRYHPGQ